MINVKDVIKIRIPYPNAVSGLAETRHMYICIEISNGFCVLAKCQTHKPDARFPINLIEEHADATRNPFHHATAIDLDKVFIANRSLFPDGLKTARGICNELLAEIIAKISKDTERIELSDDELKALNSALTPIHI